MSPQAFVRRYLVPILCVDGLFGLFVLGSGTHTSPRLVLMVGLVSSAIVAIGLAKRLHDCGISGLGGLLAFAPFLGWVAVVLFCVEEGDAGENEFGPEPLSHAR